MIAGKTEGQKKEGEASDNDNHSCEVQFNDPVLDTLPHSSVTLLLDVIALLLCTSELDSENGDEGGQDDGDDDGERAITPSPRATLKERFGRGRTSERVGDVRRVREAEEDHSVLEGCRVSHEDVEHIADAVHSGPEEDLSSSVGLDVIANSHENEC